MPRKSSASAAAYATGGTRIKPPSGLTAAERDAFATLVLSLPSNHFVDADSDLVAAYIRALVGERIADEALTAQPVVGDRASPWLSIWLARSRAVTTLARRLKLGPAGRPAPPVLSAREEPAPVSYYDKMKLMGEAFREPN